ncbi:hypothetical protein [Streptomyces canarius]
MSVSASPRTALSQHALSHVGGRVLAMVVTALAPGAPLIWAGVRPMTAISESGEARAASPIVPVSRPGKRSPSWSAGVSRISFASAGEA